MKWWPGDDDPEPIDEPEQDLPLPPRRAATHVDVELPAAPPESVSPMQEALRESGAREVADSPVPAFQTNQGTVFLASPMDIKRQELMDSVHVARGPTYFPTNAEIDRLMKEEDE